MTLDSDILIDRRRLKRRLTVWRVLAIVAFVAALAFAGARSGGDDGASGFGIGRDHIARVTISGFIGDSKSRHDMLEKLRKDDNVKAVIVAVDSPGGTTTGGEALYEDLRELANAKPVAAVFGTMATSAAYLGGIATDYIVARGNTITGSVGVIFQWADVSELLSKVGVKVDEVRSGALKAKPSPFTPVDDAARALTEQLVKDSQGWFVGLVAERRKAAVSSLEDIKTGRIYTGRQAAQVGLIDAIGDEQVAIKWFTDARKVPSGLKVRDWKPGQSVSSLLSASMSSLALKLGVASLVDAAVLEGLDILKDRPLDGLFSIWHPQLSNVR
ncbi:signal peptide peptidase SppA, 36K type [Rhodomicrobium vannielii ATCC 17100]|uniref:Signal peptide peptidase SppA, 36K type n=1 Tax=Rhodomicrobium vannielii (strain ATCC 17100 / DSM 162 / LMG 4299 / NCIMB 10020 / ATH 3.1.1) TaxID=648757 RepID=E3I1W8_RHOVT|nr:signal peptide peptidase SppA [Rhodomicrobium vannielii]ADP70187.1 signal peptide peptidase SppA, 36K type [Rhodomicrobium vannielii ATCC 17100]